MEIADYIVADDRRLVELTLAGDHTAFEYLFNRYRDAIRRLFLQRSTPPEDTSTATRPNIPSGNGSTP